MLKIYLLGSFQLTRDQTQILESDWHTKQARQLLKILLTDRGKIVPRDQLIEALWPEADPDKAATTLRTAINALRNTLEPDRPRYTPSTYIAAHAPGYKFQFTDSVWVDAQAFDQLLDKADQAANQQEKQKLITQAVALYRDDYLSDDLYADWAYLERERLQDRYLNALALLAEYQAEAGDYERAVASLRRVLARDPGREPIYRTLMRYYMQAGDTVAALRAFEQLRQYLAQELGVEPSAQSLALHQLILSGQLATQQPLSLVPVKDQSSFETIFIGREAETEILTRRLDSARQGTGGLIALIGEAGVGKTRLAQVVLEQAESQRLMTLTARCQAIEQKLPFAPIIEVLEDLIARSVEDYFDQLPDPHKMQLAQLLPSLAWQFDLVQPDTGLPGNNQRRLIESLAYALQHVARPGLVLFLDDLQWIDEATLTLLSRITRILDQTKLLLLTAYRPGDIAKDSPLAQWLHTLTRHRSMQKLDLARFSPQEVASYLQELAPSTDLSQPEAQPIIERLYRLTGGNPLFLAETLRAVLDERSPALTPDTIHQLLDDPALESPSPQVTDIILARLEQLSIETRDVLEIAAVISRDFSVELLDAIAATDPHPALALLLQRQFLIETTPARLDFSHHLVREVIYRQLSPLAKQRLHQRVAQLLTTMYGTQVGPKSAEIARHYQLAGQGVARQALKFAVLAADFAMRTFGFQEAILYCQQALALGAELPDDEEVDDWIRRAYQTLGMAQESLADWDAARETYQNLQMWAQQRHDSPLVLSAKYRLATMLGLIGQIDESAVIAARVAEQLPLNAPPAIIDMQSRLHLLVLSEPASRVWTESNWPEFEAQPVKVQRPWADIAGVLGERQALQALNLYGWGLTLQGQTTVAEATLHYVSEISASYSQTGLQATSYHLLAQLWDIRGEYTQMTSALQQALDLVENVPQLRWAVIWGRIHRAYVDMRWNRLERAGVRLDELNDELINRRAFHSHWLSVQVGLGLVAIFQQDLATATRYFAQVLTDAKDLYASNYVVLHLSRARLNRYQGDLDAAQSDIVQAMLFAGKRGMLADYISAAVEAARFDRARQRPLQTVPLLQRMEAMANQASLVPARLSVRQALSRALAQAGHHDEAGWYCKLARFDRDTVAATIPQVEDRNAYLSRRDLQALDG